MDEATRTRLASVSTATITMQLLKRGFRNVAMRGVKPLRLGPARMAGPAFTLRLIPHREDLVTPEALAGKDYPPRVAIDTCPAGAVLVVDARGVADVATAGDILLARLKARGAAGFVSDGGIRDVEEAKAVGLPLFAAGPAAPPSMSFHAAGDLGRPIGCGGVAVVPGDAVVGDADGVVVVPAHLARDVAEAGVEQERLERFIKSRVLKGRPVIGLYPPDAEARAEYEAWVKAGEPEG
jgi:regulator of RNase E activity RraA